MYQSSVHPLNLDGFIGSLVALKLDTASALVANKSLVTFQHQDGSVDQVEIISGVLFDTVNIGKQVARLLITDVFSCERNVVKSMIMRK